MIGFLFALFSLISSPSVTFFWGPHLHNPQNTSVYVNFEISASTTCEIFMYANDASEIPVSGVSGGSANTKYNVQITGLTAGVTYIWYIKFGDGSQSPAYTYQHLTNNYRVAIWGDNQIGAFAPFTDVTLKMVLEGCRGFVGVGDYIQNEGTELEWRSQFGGISNWLHYMPVWGARGNHDGEEAVYAKNRFPILSNGTSNGVNQWVAWTLGPVRYVVLDMNDHGTLPQTRALGGVQRAWLATEVASNAWKNAKYRVALFHQPHKTQYWDSGCLYGSYSPPFINQDIRFMVENQLVTNGCSLIVNGHAHCYTRGAITVSGNTCMWVITGGGGGYLDQTRCFNWPEITVEPGQGQQFNHFMTMDIDDNNLTLRCVRYPSRAVYDTFQIAARILP